MAYMAWRSEVGSTRDVNQDACGIELAQTPYGEIILALVCDGVGGLSAGEVASASVTSAFATWFEHDLPELVRANGTGFDVDVAHRAWQTLIAQAHKALRDYGSDHGVTLATTCTAMLVFQGAYVVAHVGDSRAYLLRDTGAVQLTEDQTLAMREGGGVATRGPRASTLLQAVGVGRMPAPAFGKGVLRPGDMVVLCSDGACRRVGAQGVARAFDGADPTDEVELDAACGRLVAACMRAGETDNLTVVCVCPQVNAADADVRACERAWGDAIGLPLPCDEDALATLAGDAGIGTMTRAGR